MIVMCGECLKVFRNDDELEVHHHDKHCGSRDWRAYRPDIDEQISKAVEAL